MFFRKRYSSLNRRFGHGVMDGQVKTEPSQNMGLLLEVHLQDFEKECLNPDQ